MKNRHLFVSFALGLGLALALVWVLGDRSAPAVAALRADHLEAPAAELRVCPAGPPTCDYASVQAAVDAADDGDVVKVAAGVYTGVSARAGVTQVVYISKTVTIRGGYTTANWTTPDPAANPTTLDAQGQGRVHYIVGDISPMVEGLRITGGDADGLGGHGHPWGGDGGGGVYVIIAKAILNHNWMLSNTAIHGGGLYLLDSGATLSGNTIISNTAAGYGDDGWYIHGYGGGLCLRSSDATLSENTVISNTAGYGGGLYLESSAARLNGNTVTSNTAIYGGGMYLWESNATLSNNTVTFNIAVSYDWGSGGGLYLRDSDAMLSGNIVTSNIAIYGGGLRLESSAATLNGNIITSNTADEGGGLFLDASDAKLSGNIIFSNAASDDGGGICLWASAAKLSGNIVSSNIAKYGAGLYLGNSDATLSGNTVTSNTADFGGGLYLEFQSDVTLINDIMAGNRANGLGCGLYVKGSSPRLLHTTIARNGGGNGSGVHITDYTDYWGRHYSTVALTNTILVNHIVGISVTAGNTTTLDGVLWFGNEANIGGVGTITVAQAITGNPAFALDGYHILSDSAAIDTGLDAGVRTDVDNQPRPYQTPDLGADEYWPPGALKYVYLPLVVRQYP